MSEPIRVLCVFGALDCGGSETMCMNLYRRIDRSKVQFDFVTHTTEKGVYEDEILSLGGRIFRAPRFTKFNLISYEKWWKTHLKNHPEHTIIHGHYFTLSKVYFKIAKSMGRVTVGHCHSVNTKTTLKSFFRKQLFANTEKYADFCLACSEQAGKYFFPHKSVTVINNGIDSRRFRYDPIKREETRKELGVENCFVVGVVGSIYEPKNPFETIEIFGTIKKKEPEAKLIWVGKGSMRPQVEEKTDTDGLSDSVIFTGVRLDVDRLLQAMDCYIMPSVMEGLPVALIEAQAASLRCYCSDIITKEADVTGLCTYLPLNNAKLWAETILSQKEYVREDMSERIAAAGYDVSSNIRWFEHFYLEECLKND